MLTGIMRRGSRLALDIAACVWLGIGVTSDAVAQETLACPTATTLDALATCISNQMPRQNSGLYVPPTPGEQADFAAVVTQMLTGQCEFALPDSLAANYQISTFSDSGTGKSYCLLMEVLDADGDGFVDKGWGTFIVNSNATRPMLNHSAPHPRFDSTTENQAINIFQDTDSGSYLMCGAHRHANGTTGGSCEAGYGEADCAHQNNTMFHAAVVALDQFYAGATWTHIQWHGNSSCPMDVFGSQGFNAKQPADSNVLSLRDLMAINQPDYTFELTPNGNCSLNGTENVQGRYLNGADDVCQPNDLGTPTNKFVHLEQSINIRRGGASVWDLSVGQNWPVR
jgi:hypothetical protein